MTQGVLIFAFDNELIDYLAMAEWTTRNIHRHLNLPVCVITDREHIPENYSFDRVVKSVPVGQYWKHFADFEKNGTWFNGNRVDAYNLSPWDHTLVIDADYVVASNQLKTLFDAKQDFFAPRWAYDVTGVNHFEDYNYFGQHNMPMHWATVMCFTRNKTAEAIFYSMQMIRENWSHYKEVFKFSKWTYRNDYALSIAMSLVDGHTLTHPSVPWKLATVVPNHTLTQTGQDTYRVDFTTQDKKPRWINLTQDFHALGKKHLGDIIASSL